MKTTPSKEELSQYFHLPLETAAKRLGMCSSVLKRICRTKGIERWPYRKMKSLNKKASALENAMKNAQEHLERIQMQLDEVYAAQDKFARSVGVQSSPSNITHNEMLEDDLDEVSDNDNNDDNDSDTNNDLNNNNNNDNNNNHLNDNNRNNSFSSQSKHSSKDLLQVPSISNLINDPIHPKTNKSPFPFSPDRPISEIYSVNGLLDCYTPPVCITDKTGRILWFTRHLNQLYPEFFCNTVLGEIGYKQPPFADSPAGYAIQEIHNTRMKCTSFVIFIPQSRYIRKLIVHGQRMDCQESHPGFLGEYGFLWFVNVVYEPLNSRNDICSPVLIYTSRCLQDLSLEQALRYKNDKEPSDFVDANYNREHHSPMMSKSINPNSNSTVNSKLSPESCSVHDNELSLRDRSVYKPENIEQNTNSSPNPNSTSFSSCASQSNNNINHSSQFDSFNNNKPQFSVDHSLVQRSDKNISECNSNSIAFQTQPTTQTTPQSQSHPICSQAPSTYINASSRPNFHNTTYSSKLLDNSEHKTPVKLPPLNHCLGPNDRSFPNQYEQEHQKYKIRSEERRFHPYRQSFAAPSNNGHYYNDFLSRRNLKWSHYDSSSSF